MTQFVFNVFNVFENYFRRLLPPPPPPPTLFFFFFFFFFFTKAYIPPERKIPGVGGWRWAMPPTPDFCVTQRKIYQHVGIIWRYPRRQSPTPILKFALPPTPNPDASQWNIAGVGSQRKMLALAMYISFFFCRFHLRLYPTRTQFPVEYGLKPYLFQ